VIGLGGRTLSTTFRIGRERLSSLSPTAKVACVIAAGWVVVAILAPIIAPTDPLHQSASLLQAPSWSHLMGTDDLGRDVLSRVIYGARLTIPYATFVVLISVTTSASGQGQPLEIEVKTVIIGDASDPGNFLTAMHSAWELALRL